ncbi:MAG: iron-only hydrogenase system regulator [Oscillospiraceae bacterium]|nr:iron-only hydrogenase system regulator [Oscillospiraceae bacterium]
MCNATDSRVALVGILLSNANAAEQVNAILGEYSQYVVGRMGLPYREKNVHIISVVVDAPNDTISALCGKLGMVPDSNVKVMYTKA